MDSKLKGVTEWSDIVAKDGYNGWITNMAENFTGQTDRWVNAIYPLVEGSMDHMIAFVGKLWIGWGMPIYSQRAKCPGVCMTKVDQYLVLGNNKFVL